MTTLNDLFPGNLGKVRLTRVAIQLRKPELMRANPDEALPDDLVAELKKAAAESEKG